MFSNSITPSANKKISSKFSTPFYFVLRLDLASFRNFHFWNLLACFLSNSIPNSSTYFVFFFNFFTHLCYYSREMNFKLFYSVSNNIKSSIFFLPCIFGASFGFGIYSRHFQNGKLVCCNALKYIPLYCAYFEIT